MQNYSKKLGQFKVIHNIMNQFTIFYDTLVSIDINNYVFDFNFSVYSINST